MRTSRHGQGAQDNTRELLEGLAERFGPLAKVFGSVATVSAFLLYAGFLSDFAAYQLAGLPRLSFSVTAIAESGVEVLIDALSLLVGGLRMAVLGALLGGVVLLWSFHEHKFIRSHARSIWIYQICRVVVLLFALLILVGMVDRVQRSLNDSELQPDRVEIALRRAYANGIPNPWQRQTELEKESYAFRFNPLLEWAALSERNVLDLFYRDSRLRGAGERTRSLVSQGISLRNLPESRDAARQRFGWLILSLVALSTSLVLMSWWQAWLRAGAGSESESTRERGTGESKCERDDAAVATQDETVQYVDSLGTSDENQVRRERGWQLFGRSFAEPLERIVVPATIALTTMAVVLMPLLHGLMARASLGGENVMVYLTAPSTAASKVTKLVRSDAARESVELGTADPLDAVREEERNVPALYPEPSATGWPSGRFDCALRADRSLAESRRNLGEAARDFVQTHPSEEIERAEAKRNYGLAVERLTKETVAAGCAEGVRQFWASRPPTGLAMLAPELAGIYRQGLLRVTMAYGVRLGTILTYPRDAQPLTIVDSIVPKHTSHGQWSVQTLERSTVGESVVLPNVIRRLQDIEDTIRVAPTHDDLSELLVAPSGDALEVVLRLLRDRKLHAEEASVAVTAAGVMAWVTATERPDISTRAIEMLADLASATPSTFWPCKDENIRSAAATALHLTRSPYAARLFAELLDVEAARDNNKQCVMGEAERTKPLGALDTSGTAAGFLAEALVREASFFTDGQAPDDLGKVRDALLGYLVRTIVSPATRDDLRGSACTALGFAGITELPENTRRQFWDYLRNVDPATIPFSMPICISRLAKLRLDGEEQRQFLRKHALGEGNGPRGEVLGTSMRDISLLTLSFMGLSGEHDLLFSLYVDTTVDDDVADRSAMYFREVSGEKLAVRLARCGESRSMARKTRERCLDGFQYLKHNFDGDDGTAHKMWRILSNGSERRDVRDAACRALRVFQARNGMWVRRHHKDAVVSACLRDAH